MTLCRRYALAGPLLFGLATTSLPAQSPPPPLTAQAAYDTVQRFRDVAERLWQAGDRTAFDTLRAALDFLARPDVRDLAQGWPYLNGRAPNAWYDVARYRAQDGDTAAALAALEAVARSGGNAGYGELIQNDTLFRALRNHPRLQAVVRGLAAERRLWNDAAFSTPYAPTIELDRRLAGLAQLWAEVRWGFPDFRLRPDLDWDSLFIAYLPRVRAVDSTVAYYRVLQQFIAELGDGHSNVYFPREVYDASAAPPIRTTLVEGRILVTDVLSPTVAGLGVRVGQEVETIDGMPARDYAATRVAPFRTGSTPQHRAIAIYTYALLWGDRDAPVRLGLRARDGTRTEVTLLRSGYPDREQRPNVRDSVLPGNIGYLRVDDFEQDSIVRLMREAVARMRGTRGLVIDIRHNGGGNSGIGYRLLTLLAREPFLTSEARVRSYNAYYRVRGFDPLPTVFPAREIAPDTSMHYDGPVVVLAGPETFSAAEDFLVAYRQMGRGPIIGEATGGSTGQPLFFRMPAGGSARVRAKHDSYADGREFDGIGVVPDRVVHTTVAGIRAGRDEVLEAGLRVLREAGGR